MSASRASVQLTMDPMDREQLVHRAAKLRIPTSVLVRAFVDYAQQHLDSDPRLQRHTAAAVKEHQQFRVQRARRGAAVRYGQAGTR